MTKATQLSAYLYVLLNGALAVALLPQRQQLSSRLPMKIGPSRFCHGMVSTNATDRRGHENKKGVIERQPAAHVEDTVDSNVNGDGPFFYSPGCNQTSSTLSFITQLHHAPEARTTHLMCFAPVRKRKRLYSTDEKKKYGPGDIEYYDNPEDMILPGEYDLGIPKEDMEALRKVLDSVDADDDGDEDQRHPLSDVYFRYWSKEPDEMEKMLQIGERMEKEWETAKDLQEVCQRLNLPQPMGVKHELAVAMLREMFNRRVRPKGYIESLMDELGITAIKEYFFPSETKRETSKWRFGIELKDPNIDIQPLTETALRGYLGVPYYEHLKKLSSIHRENARRILTIIHRIYDSPILYTDLRPDREPSDQDLYLDSENLKRSQCNAYKRFVDTYPDLKWPVDDEGFLDIYAQWYPHDKPEEVNTLPELMKQAYGTGSSLSAPNFYYRFLAIPVASCAAGLTTGTFLHNGISAMVGMLGGIHAQLTLESIVGPKVCSAVVSLLTWLGLARDMSVKGDIFSVALKSLVDNGLENPQELISTIYSGLIPRHDIVDGLESFVVNCTLTAFHRAMRLSRDAKGIDTWNLLTKQVGRVAEVCLPICGISVYRIMYNVACDLASSEDLPQAQGNEVLGRDISGDKEDPHEDYTWYYEEGNRMLGLPQVDRAKFEKNAMLLTAFCLQAFSGMKGFVRVSEDEIDAYQLFKKNAKELGVPDDAWDNIKEGDMMPSTLDDVEKFAKELEATNGKFKRITLEREYGFDPLNDFMGETEEETSRRMQIEMQEARDALLDLSPPRGYKLEMIKALSIIMYLREEWVLERIPKFLKKQCTEFIASEIENMSGNLGQKIKEFGISSKHNDDIKTDAMFILAQRLQDSDALDHDKALQMAQVAGISEEIALDACSAATFPTLMEELSSWDLAAVTADQINEIKSRYRCKDLVFINALCEVIKKFASETKKEMINARNKLNWNLVERHMSALLRGRNAVVNAAASTIDCKFWYRIERAFRFNRPFVEHKFTIDDITGRGKVAVLPNLDWELMDPPPKKTYLQTAKEEFEANLENLEPLKATGEDTQRPLPFQMQLSEMVKKGELDPEFECLPTEFNIGEKPREPEYELEQEPVKDKFELQRPIMDSSYAYACWIVYCYRKRGVSKGDIKTVLTIFPFLEKLVERSDTDWRRLYARQRLGQKDSLGSLVNWEEEFNCDKETAERICGIAYEEDLLKRTGAVVEHIEDDIGDVKDTYFNPFDPSIYNRLNYLYSEQIPSDLELENIKKLQTFFKLSPAKIEEIHTKCFSFALDQYCANLIKESPKDWPQLVEEQVKPLAKKLSITEGPLNMIINKTEFDYLTREANRLTIDRTPGKDFLERTQLIVDEFKRLKVLTIVDGKPRLKFTIRAQTEGFMGEVMCSFIVSHCDIYGKVDQSKLNEFCMVYGLWREKRKELLNKLGRQFYYKFLSNFKDEDLTIDCLKEIEHLNKTYELDQKDVEDAFIIHLRWRIMDLYDPKAGLETMQKLVVLLHGEDFHKVTGFERSRRVHWFINIIRDCIDKGVDKGETRVFSYSPDQFFSLQFNGGEENFDSIQGILNLSSRILNLSQEEYKIARIVAAEEIGAVSLEKIQQLVKVKDGLFAADQEMSRFIRALSIAPSDSLQSIKKHLPLIKDYDILRRLVMMLPCSDETLGKGVKLIDALEKA